MPQLPNITLPKVAKYITNVGKSVKFAAIDYLGEDTAPNITSFLEDNDELFKEVYSATVNYRETVRKAKVGIQRSRIWEAGTQAWSSLKEDLKTGNWYNKEREEILGAKALGMDMDDMEFDDSMFGFENDDFSDTAKQTRALDTSIEVAAKANAAITVQSSQLIANTVKDSATLLYAQNEKMMGQMTAGLGSVHIAVSKVGEFLQGPVLTALQNTKTFQEETVKHQKKLEAQLDELLEMQRNLYKMPEQSKTSSTFGDVVDYDGIPDLKAYAKQIYKNFKTAMGPEFGQLFGDSFGKDSNMLMLFATSPLKAIPEMFVKMVVPMTLKQTIETFDKSLGGLFAGFIGRMNNLAKNGGFGDIFGKIGEILGLKIEEKTTVNTGNYKKGPVPFDGITRQAIIEVIPAHLRRIEAALTGGEEKVYDYSTGRYVPIKTIEKQYKDQRAAAKDMPWWDLQQDLKDYVRKLSQNQYNVKLKDDEGKATEMKSTELAEAITKAMASIIDKTYEDNGVFLGYRRHKDRSLGEKEIVNAADYYGVPVEVYREIMRFYNDPKNRGRMMNLTNEILKSKQSLTDTMRNAEQSGYHVYNQLFNGLSDNFKATEAFNSQKKLTKGTLGFLNTTLDDKGKNVFFYLQGIYGTLLANGSNGAPTGRRKRRKGAVIAIPFTPEQALEEAIRKSTPITKSEEKQIYEMVDENGELITVDESQNYFDQMRLNQLAKEDEKKKSEADSIFGVIKSGGSIGQKFKDIKGIVQEYIDKPAAFVNKIIHAADMRIYELFYGKEEMLKDEKEYGRDFNGLIDRLMFRMEESFDKLDDWFRDHFFKDINNFLVESGIKSKYNKAKDWLKDKIGWENIKDSFRNKFGIAKSNVTGAFSAVGNDIANSGMGQQVLYTRALTRIGHTALRPNQINPDEVNRITWADVVTKSELSQINKEIQDLLASDPNLQYSDAEQRVFAKWAVDLEPRVQKTIEEQKKQNAVPGAAHGKYVTKRGLVMVSPGETIIPAGGKHIQKAQFVREAAFARKLGFTGGLYAAGGAVRADLSTPEGDNSSDGRAKVVNIDDYRNQSKQDEEAQKSTVRKIIEELTPGTGYANIITSGLIGGGLSLMTGLIGGPLLGAAAGSAISILNQSETAKSILFGKMGEDGEREGGWISKEFQQKFHKYFPDMKNYGIVGAITGLFTPLGLVGGMLAGAGVSYLKNNEKVQEYLFGPADKNGERDGGLIKKKYREMINKAAPRMLIGAVGGAVLGPFGILPGAAMGAGIGFLTTTDEFHTFIFGEEQEDGTRKGGVVGAINEGFVQPMKEFGKKLLEDGKEFFKDKVLNPLKNFVQPVLQMVNNMFTAIGDKISDAFHDKVVTPVSDFIQHKLLEPFGGLLMKVLKIPFNAAKKVIGAPFSLLQGIGNNIRGTQIAKGTANDMSAAERVQWREQHKGRSIFGKVMGKDKFNAIDQMLVSEFEGKEGLEQLKGMRDALNIYMKNKKKFGSNAAKLQQKLVEDISDFLNTKTMEVNGKTISIYTYIGFKPVSNINKLIANTDARNSEKTIKEIIDVIKGRLFKSTPYDIRVELINMITARWPEISKALVNSDSELKDNKQFLDAMNIISKHKITSFSDVKRLFRNIDKEVSVRETEMAFGKGDDAKLREELADKRIKFLIKANKTLHDELIDTLNAIGFSLNPNFKPIYGSAKISNSFTSTTSSTTTSTDASGSRISETDREVESFINDRYMYYINMGYDFNEASKLAKEDADKEFASKNASTDQLGRFKSKLLKYRPMRAISNIFRGGKNLIGEAKDELGRFSRDTLGFGKKIAGFAAHEAGQLIKTPGAMLKGFKEGFANGANGDGGKSQFRGLRDEGLHTMGGVFHGAKEKVLKMFNSGYSINSEGDVVSNKTKEPIDPEKAKEWKRKEELEAKYKGSLLDGVKKTAEGALGLVGNFFGKRWKNIKNGVGAFTGLVSQLLDSTGVVGMVIKGIFGIGKVIIGASLIGHAIDFFNRVLKPIIAPIWENITTAIKSAASSVWEWAQEHLPESFINGINDMREKAVLFFANPLNGIVNFIGDGLQKFWTYVKPHLYTLIWNAFHNDNLDANKYASERTTEDYSVHLQDKEGRKYYKTADGRITTDEYDENGVKNKEYVINGQTTSIQTDNAGFIAKFSNIIDHGAFGQLENQELDIINGNEVSISSYGGGYVTIRNSTTGDFIRYKKNTNIVEIGTVIKNKDTLEAKYDSEVAELVMGTLPDYIKWSGDLAYSAVGKVWDHTVFANPGKLINGGGKVMHGVGTITDHWTCGKAYNKYVMKSGTCYVSIKVDLNSANVNSLFALATELGWDGTTTQTKDKWPCYYATDGTKLYVDDALGTSPSDPPEPTGDNSGSNRKGFGAGGRGGGRKSSKPVTRGRESQKPNTRRDSNYHSGRGHVYQHATELANQKFGNSTIGEAGCGPVAATNLINKLGGNMSVGAAARYAEQGGFVDSTGGTTTNYFKSILGSSGIPSAETSNKADIYNSLKSGNPVVMLGNSGQERGTPFGANDHYITAMGLDRKGNIIAEDPDLPDGYKTYNASRVLNDMDVGIATGMSRFGRLSAKARRRSGKAHVYSDPGGGGSAKISVPAWQMRAAEACCVVESANIGNYSAVNCNDVESMSLGRYQFRGPRAVKLLARIIKAIVANGSATDAEIQNLLGSKLYNYAIGKSGNKYIASKTDKANLEKLLSYDESAVEQNLQMCEDVQGYFNTLKKYHSDLNIKDNEDIIIFWGIVHIHNVGNGGTIKSYDIPKMKAINSNSKNWSLDDVYKTYVSYGKRASAKRAEMVYNWLKNTKPVGDSPKVIANGYKLVEEFTNYGATAADEVSSGSGAHDTSSNSNSVLSKFGETVSNTLRTLYGPMFDALFGSSTSSDGSSVNGYSGDGTYNGNLNPTANSAQKALVDRMNSVHGKLRYSLEGGQQNPDKGVGSCASTVGWAYKKVLNVGGMSAGSSTQSKDSRFTTIWTKTTNNGAPPQDLLQPGDILYINWNRQKKPFDGSMQYPMGHTEMYDGNGGTVNHGGGSNGTTYGTTNHQLSTRNGYIMKVNRYTQFVNGEKPPFTNLDGSAGQYGSTGLPTGMTGTEMRERGLIPGTTSNNTVGTSGLTGSEYIERMNSTTGNSGGSRHSLSGRARNTMNPLIKKSNKFSAGIIKDLAKLDEPEVDKPPAEVLRSGGSRGGARMASYGGKSVSYEDFLNVIVSLLKVIANNSDNLAAILALLKDKFNTNIETADITSNSKSAQRRLRDSLRKSGMGRSGSPSMSTPGDQYGGVSDDSSNDLKYIVNILNDMARA